MSAKIKLTVILALMALILVVAGGVQAQEPPPNLDDPEVVEGIIRQLNEAGDPQQVYLQLTSEERDAVMAFMTVSSVTVIEATYPVDAPVGEVSGASGDVSC